ncbi:hypothetical protein F2Q70_00031350 [Brassica cretica]|uniref:C-JID domain-containing protein n=1 Tax=Brassica cretica TaxID=69181 RepID=A0A8S9FI33_BRACR|nr:hypothetical protein F2Q70_00031350 [Brassica cretica]
MWLPHQQEFRDANSGSLTIKLKSKPIKIELFPGCHIITEDRKRVHARRSSLFSWYLCSIYTIGLTFDIQWLYHYISTQFTDPQRGHKECLSTFLTRFAPLSVWNVQVNKKTCKIHALPTLIHHNDYQRGVRPDFNLNDSKAYDDFQTHAFRLNSATQKFPIPFIPNWFYYPIDYQMSLDEDLHFYLDKRANSPIVQDIPKKEKRNFESQECPPDVINNDASDDVIATSLCKHDVSNDVIAEHPFDSLMVSNWQGSKLDVLIGVCYPSWQLPVWFNHRTVGSELKQNLPRHWNEDGLTGIALCAVVSFRDYQAKNNRLLVRCTAEFKEKDEPVIQFSCILGGWTGHGSDRPRDIIKSSGHVFIGYTSLLHIKKWDIEELFAATEASFEFEVTDGTNQITNCEVFILTMVGRSVVRRPRVEATSTMKKIGSEITEKVQSFKATRNVTDIKPGAKTVAASSKGGSGIPLEVSFDATTKNKKGGSMSPMSSGEGEVIDEESPKIDETNQGVETGSCESPKDTEKSGNEHNTRNGANNLCERMEKPIRLICLVVSICACSVFLLGKDNKKR